jgi:hypothetical protein
MGFISKFGWTKTVGIEMLQMSKHLLKYYRRVHGC